MSKKMDSYVEMAVELFRASAAKAHLKSDWNKAVDLDLPEEFEMMRDVELYLHGDTSPLSEVFEVDKMYLPEDHLLTDEQTEVLANEAEKLWFAYNFIPDFPDNTPARMRYKAMRDNWEKQVVFISSGNNHLGLCNEIEEECPFPGYCTTCRDFAEDFKDEDFDMGGYGDGVL